MKDKIMSVSKHIVGVIPEAVESQYMAIVIQELL